jgi:hypothetical protein
MGTSQHRHNGRNEGIFGCFQANLESLKTGKQKKLSQKKIRDSLFYRKIILFTDVTQVLGKSLGLNHFVAVDFNRLEIKMIKIEFRRNEPYNICAVPTELLKTILYFTVD